MDQRDCIKFCLKNEIKFVKSFEILTTAFGEFTMSRSQVQLWYNRFEGDRKDVNDNDSSWLAEHVNNG